MHTISIEEALQLKDVIFVDTRTPAEFAEDHILNAVNIPIFDNEERAEIGTLYKESQDEAFNLGLEYYSKKLPLLVKELRKLDKTKKIVVHCWRGGLRSKALTQMVDLLGYEVYQLVGGYKSYRAHVREYFENYETAAQFVILHGNTGCAKTKVLHKLSPIIDLEDLAQHRSSLFGGVGLETRPQKLFETMLFNQLHAIEGERVVFVEGESRKLGPLFIPTRIFEKMKVGINLRITAQLATRVANIVDEYFKPGLVDEIAEIIPQLERKLGRKKVVKLLDLMTLKKYDEVVKILLLEYYDPLYGHGINKLEYSHNVESDDIDMCARTISQLILE